MTGPHPIGLAGLIRELGLQTEAPAVRSQAEPAARRTVESPQEVLEVYPAQYDCTTLEEHLRFALRNEPMDLRVWRAVLDALPPVVVERWVQQQPASVYARRAWYLLESLTGTTLDLPDCIAAYADLAPEALQVVWRGSGHPEAQSRRHRIRNNLLGHRGYCPLVRHTRTLEAHRQRQYDQQVFQLSTTVDPLLFQRASDYLYLSETKSTYAIEGEKPAAGRAERFAAALMRAGESRFASEQALVGLQQQIIQDQRFAAQGWRRGQNYVSRTRIDYSEDIQYICPRPEDLAALMGEWMAMVKKIYSADATDAVALAACAAFGFVYLHPFDDGNGRIHRFLIHHVLAQRGYTPPGIVFPVSAVMHRRRKDYEAVLQTISRMVNQQIEYTLDDASRMTVTSNTIDLYRYPDLTPHAEFLYECIAETVEKDWPRELSFLTTFDSAFRAIQNIVDMPDAKIRLLVRLLLQNNGMLAAGKRALYDFLTDEEVSRIEDAVQPLVNSGFTGGAL
ncbi:MAG: Fic family protein [Candidatus Solibacter usitatus]|nr:Fic family protein [Candidatus Solibacter usitatus]